MNNLMDTIKQKMQIGTKLYNKTSEAGTPIRQSKLNNLDMDMNDGIIDEESMTPRAFDKTKKSMGVANYTTTMKETTADQNNGRNINEGGINEAELNANTRKGRNRGQENRYSSDEDESNEVINRDSKDDDEICNNMTESEFMDNINLNKKRERNEYSQKGNSNNINNSRESLNNNFDYNNKMNGEIENNTSSFMSNGWGTPKKSNVGHNYYSGIDNPSTLKKYKTPSEMDMLNPDGSLIGNKCITINNYVNPPKFVSQTFTPSKFPLSGEKNPDMTYEDFRGFFKNNACIISEHEFNSKKVKHKIGDNDRKYFEKFNIVCETNLWPNKRGVSQSVNKSAPSITTNTTTMGNSNDSSISIRSSNHRSSERNLTYSNTYGNYGNSSFLNNYKESPKCKKRKGDGSPKLSTKKLLSALSGNDTKKKDHSNGSPIRSYKKSKTQANEKEDSEYDTDGNKQNKFNFIDYELNPVLKTEKDTNKTNECIIMETLCKHKQNPITTIYEPYSKDLDDIFNKNVIKTPITLLNLYQYLLIIISRRNKKNQPVFYRLIKQEIANLNPSCVFTEDMLKQLAWIAPNLIQLNKVVITKEIYEANHEIYTDYVTGRKVEDIQIREHTEKCENIYEYTSSDKLEMLKRIIINWANIKHTELLKKINPDFYFPKYSELKKWHSLFNFNQIIFPSVILEENKILAQLARTPQESNADDFIVIQDSPIKCATIDLKKNKSFIKEMEKEKTRTPLGRNKRKSNFLFNTNNSNSNTSNSFASQGSPKKRETDNMKQIREEAHKKNIIKLIKDEFDKEYELLVSEKKKFENAKWIAEIIHDQFIVEGTCTVIELKTFAKKVADKYKSNKDFKMDEHLIAELIEILPEYVTDIHVKPCFAVKDNMNLSVKTKKNLFNFLQPLSNKIEDISNKYEQAKNNKENRLNELWKKHNVNFEITENIKKYFFTPGSIALSNL
ncbi:conserved Plasmodium protein, unknown function [Plasmodium vinckei lentum]|uniref:CDT1 Geminin-binding domain-containing protein n=1 Tax=Plasmodium vinckei lentum TaxID=138297 RepID=A0A6V7ST86_PLAVN|nr:conserved Plasmodium protein, unknown function [Plasmodium vinckei lentum]